MAVKEKNSLAEVWLSGGCSTTLLLLEAYLVKAKVEVLFRIQTRERKCEINSPAQSSSLLYGGQAHQLLTQVPFGMPGVLGELSRRLGGSGRSNLVFMTALLPCTAPSGISLWLAVV